VLGAAVSVCSRLLFNDAHLAIRHLDAPGKRAEMVAAVVAAGNPYPLAGRSSELPHHGRRDDLAAIAFEEGGRPLGLGLCLIADRFEAGEAILERRVVQIGHAAFNGIVKTFEPQIGFRCLLVRERSRSFRTLIAWRAPAGPAAAGQGRSREAVARNAPALTG